MRKVNIDLEKYMVYEDDKGDYVAAVEIMHQLTMNEYYRKYDHFKSAPDNISIQGYEIVPDNEPSSVKVDLNRKRNFRVNKLRGTWIRSGR